METSPATDGAFLDLLTYLPGIYTLRTVPGNVTPLAKTVVADREIAGITVPGYAELSGKAMTPDGRKFPACPRH